MNESTDQQGVSRTAYMQSKVQRFKSEWKEYVCIFMVSLFLNYAWREKRNRLFFLSSCRQFNQKIILLE